VRRGGPRLGGRALAETLGLIGLPGAVTITAGIGHGAMLLDLPVEEWDCVLTVNARGPWLVMRAIAKALIGASAPGSFIATSGVSAHLVDRSMGAYCASKAALSMLVKVAACEWTPFHLRVNAVGPGVTMTPMFGEAATGQGWWGAVEDRTPLGRLGQAGDIAQAIFACTSWIGSPARSSTWTANSRSTAPSMPTARTPAGLPGRSPDDRLSPAASAAASGTRPPVTRTPAACPGRR
jgi:NAD(P)-dependent dehydrogenase (short-subunit alcohol dehydrogenase family)